MHNPIGIRIYIAYTNVYKSSDSWTDKLGDSHNVLVRCVTFPVKFYVDYVKSMVKSASSEEAISTIDFCNTQ